MKKKNRDHSKQFEYIQSLLAVNIKERRKQLGLSQEELAGLVDIDRTYMSGIERSLQNPSLSILADLARELQTEPAILISKGPFSKS